MRQVLSFELKWIKEVQYQFAYGLREDAFKALRMNVAYQKTRRYRMLRAYNELFSRLMAKVKISRQRQQEAHEIYEEKLKEDAIRKLKLYKLYQQKKKANMVKADDKCIKWLKKVGYTKLKEYYTVRRAIRNDKLLW